MHEEMLMIDLTGGMEGKGHCSVCLGVDGVGGVGGGWVPASWPLPALPWCHPHLSSPWQPSTMHQRSSEQPTNSVSPFHHYHYHYHHRDKTTCH